MVHTYMCIFCFFVSPLSFVHTTYVTCNVFSHLYAKYVHTSLYMLVFIFV